MCIRDSLFSFFFLMIRRPPRSTRVRSSAASDVYKRQVPLLCGRQISPPGHRGGGPGLSLIHISEPTRLLSISYAVFCLKKKKNFFFFFFLMIRRPPRSTRVRSSAASDVYKRQVPLLCGRQISPPGHRGGGPG